MVKAPYKGFVYGLHRVLIFGGINGVLTMAHMAVSID